MTITLSELMRTVRNYFVSGAADGPWQIADGILTGSAGQRPPVGWVAVDGAGVYQVAADGAIDAPDRAWDGPLHLLAPPDDFLRLLADINDWLAARGAEAVTAGTVTRRRESFGAYTTDTSYAAGSTGASWTAAFADRLAPFRRMFPDVRA